MRAMSLALSLTSIILAQDQPPSAATIQELVHNLRAEAYAVREDAEKRLIKFGGQVLEEVRKALTSDDAEVRERAERIVAIVERNLRVARCGADLTLISLSGRFSVKDVLNRLRGEAADLFDTTAIGERLDTELTLDVKNGSPFEVLDAVCKQLSVGFAIESGRVKFVPQAKAPIFSEIKGAFRIQAGEALKYTSDKPQARPAWAVTLAGDAFPACKTFGPPDIELVQVTDDQGHAAGPVQRLFVLGGDLEEPLGKPGAEMPSRAFTIVAAKSAPCAVTLQGTAAFYFPIGSQTVTIDAPDGIPAGQEHQVPGELFEIVLFKGKVFNLDRRNFNGLNERPKFILQFRPSLVSQEWLDSVDPKLLAPGSIVVVKKDGSEAAVTFTRNGPKHFVMSADEGVGRIYPNSLTLDLGKTKPEDIKELKVTIPELHRREVPFEIKNVPLR